MRFKPTLPGSESVALVTSPSSLSSCCLLSPLLLPLSFLFLFSLVFTINLSACLLSLATFSLLALPVLSAFLILLLLFLFTCSGELSLLSTASFLKLSMEIRRVRYLHLAFSISLDSHKNGLYRFSRLSCSASQSSS